MDGKEKAEVLREAARVLERDGWGQGAFHGATGEHCTLGAVQCAMGLYDTQNKRFRDPASAVKDWYEYEDVVWNLAAGIDYEPVPMWNDTVGRTQEDAVKLLLTTADEVEVQ